MRSEFEPRRHREKGRVLISACLAGLTAVIGFINWLLLDNLLKSVLVHSSIDPFSWTLFEDAFLLIIGIAWLCIVFYSHHYYSKGARKGRLWIRFARMSGIQVLIIFVSQVLLILVNGTFASITVDAVAVIEGVVGVSLTLIARLAPAPTRDSTYQSGM